MTETRELTSGQRAVLIAATVPMIGAGGLGAWGTFTNITAEFGRAATALGVVAAGEGVTLVLALVMVGLTMLGQAAPWPVRAGLWAAPVAAAVTGVVVADNGTEAVVYGITPMAMCASAEGLGLLARRIVVYRTKVDIEAQRRNARIMRRIAFHRARAERHPKDRVQKRSALIAWWLLRRAGEGDAELGVDLIRVQRVKLTEGAELALDDMLTGSSPVPALPAPEPVREPAPEPELEPALELEPRQLYGFDHAHQRRVPVGTEDEGLPPATDPEPEPEPEHQREPDPEPEREPDDEPEPEPVVGDEHQQIMQLAARLLIGEEIAKKGATELLGVSPATAQRRMTQARRVVKLTELLKAGDRLTPATAAPLLGVDEKTAGLRLTEARQLNGEGTGLYL